MDFVEVGIVAAQGKGLPDGEVHQAAGEAGRLAGGAQVVGEQGRGDRVGRALRGCCGQERDLGVGPEAGDREVEGGELAAGDLDGALERVVVRGQDLTGRADGPEGRGRDPGGDRTVSGNRTVSDDWGEGGGVHDQEPAVEVCASPLLALTEPDEEKLVDEVSELELVVLSELDDPVVVSVVAPLVVSVEVAMVVDVECVASW